MRKLGVESSEGVCSTLDPTSDEGEPEEEEETEEVSLQKASLMTRDLVRFCVANNLPEKAGVLSKFQSELHTLALTEKAAQPQKTISAFFKPVPRP